VKFNNAPCTSGQTCSKWGWCQRVVSSTTHQSSKAKMPRSDGRCGPEFANAPCAHGQLCSKWGWCQN
jgi:hypothetical protein